MACTCGGHNEALFAQLDNVIEQHKDQRGSLISVLHKHRASSAIYQKKFRLTLQKK